MVGGNDTGNFGSTGPGWSEIGDFEPIFARSASAVTPIAKKVQLILIWSLLRAFQWAQDKPRTLSLSLPKGAQKSKVSKIWTISCNNSETVRDRICQLLFITNRKSHTGFRLVPTSMTLNYLERRSHYFAFFLLNSIDFRADYTTS